MKIFFYSTIFFIFSIALFTGFGGTCYGATEFISKINTTGEDYNTLTSWETAMDDAGDLTDGTVKTGNWDNMTVGYIPDASAVTWDSGASTGNLIHMTGTQYLIDVTAGTLADNDTVSDGTRTFDVNGTPDSAIIVAEAYKDQGDLEDPVMIIDGLTTSAANYMIIRAAANSKHNGIPGAGFVWKNTTVDSNTMGITDNYVVLQDLEVFYNVSSASGRSAVLVYGTTNNVTVKNCIVKALNPGAGSGAGITFAGTVTNSVVVNTLAYESKTAGIFLAALDGNKNYCYNCTSVNNGNYGINMYAAAGNTTGEIIVKNSLATGNGTADFVDTAAGSVINTISYSASGDATADDWGGPGITINQTFRFVNSGSDNFHLSGADGGAKNKGTNLSNDGIYAFNTDIDGQTRPPVGSNQLWDIGADQNLLATVINTPLSGRFIDSSLKGYWSFDGADMDWASTTAEALDRSGQNNNGNVTNFGQEGAKPGINGQALSFDGSDDYVAVTDAAQTGLDITGSITVSAWVKADTLPTTDWGTQYIVAKYGSAGRQYTLNTIRWGTTPYVKAFRFIISDGSSFPAVATNGILEPITGIWYHVVGVWDQLPNPDELRIYVNGNLININTTSIASIADTAADFRIGSDANNANYFDGSVDEVRVYSRALSASEIAEQYRAGAGRLKANTPITLAGPQSGLVGNWTFNGQDTTWTSATAGTTTDLSGSGNTGMMMNMFRSFSPAIGKVGQALSFDGVNDYISLVSNPLSSMAASSVSMWVKLNNLLVGSGAFSQTFLNLYTDASNQLRIGHAEDVAAGCIFVSYSSGGSSYGRQTNGGKVTANAWYHIVYTFVTPAGLNIYVNGVDSDTGANTNSNGLANVIGARSNVSGTTNGLIDEVRIYNRALSTDEILQLYRLGTRKFQPTQ